MIDKFDLHLQMIDKFPRYNLFLLYHTMCMLSYFEAKQADEVYPHIDTSLKKNPNRDICKKPPPIT